MSYKKRNGLILLSFVFIISAIGVYFSYFHFPSRIENIQEEISEIELKVEDIPKMQQELDTYKGLRENNTDKLANLDKEIELHVAPAQTYSYLDRIQDKFGAMKMDVSFVSGKDEQGYGYNIFTLSGEAYFYVLMRMIWALERGPKIYRITRMSMRGLEEINQDKGKLEVKIPYEMEIWALYADVQDFPPIKRTLTDVRMPNFHNPFWPMVYKGVPPNVKNLLEIDKATVRAVMPGKAIIIAHDGRVLTLREGDKVYLGYVSKIDNTRNRVEFTLNKGGIYEKQYLTLNFE